MSKILGVPGLIGEYWERMARKHVGLPNAAAIVVQNPDVLRARFITEAPLGLLKQLVGDSKLKDAIHLFRCVRARIVAQNPPLVPIRDALIVAALNTVARKPLRTSRDILFWFNAFKMSDDPISVAIGDALLQRVINTSSWEIAEWRSARHLSWEAYAFIPALADRSLVAADKLFWNVPASVSSFDLAAIIGILCLGGKEPDITAARLQNVFPVKGAGVHNLLALLAVRTFPSTFTELAAGALAAEATELLHDKNDGGEVVRRLIKAVSSA